MKTEPETYSWGDLVRERVGVWDGVRSFEARKHLRGMARGDRVLVYHSGKERAVVGVASVERGAYPDPTADGDDWSAVDLRALGPLVRPVELSSLRERAEFADFVLLRRGRLSVMPVPAALYRRLLTLGKTKAY